MRLDGASMVLPMPGSYSTVKAVELTKLPPRMASAPATDSEAATCLCARVRWMRHRGPTVKPAHRPRGAEEATVPPSRSRVVRHYQLKGPDAVGGNAMTR